MGSSRTEGILIHVETFSGSVLLPTPLFVPSNVSAQTRNQAQYRICFQNEVICTGIERSRFVEFSFHRREHKNRSADFESAKLTDYFKAIPRSRMGNALRAEVELDQDRIVMPRFSTLPA
jgi:hypothetical protein